LVIATGILTAGIHSLITTEILVRETIVTAIIWPGRGIIPVVIHVATGTASAPCHGEIGEILVIDREQLIPRRADE